MLNLFSPPAERIVVPMEGYGQFCPVALASEVFAERWTPLLLRELLHGPKRFSDLHRGVPRMSRNLLVQRLASLESAGLIGRTPVPNGHGSEYRLTPAGEAARPVIDALGAWGYKWYARDLKQENVDPDHLMWVLRRYLRVENLPETRVVTCFRFPRQTTRRYWLVLERPDVDLCLFDPGYELDVEVVADTGTLAQICLGLQTVAGAVRTRKMQVSGVPRLCRQLGSWLGVSRFAFKAGAPEPTLQP